MYSDACTFTILLIVGSGPQSLPDPQSFCSACSASLPEDFHFLLLTSLVSHVVLLHPYIVSFPGPTLTSARGRTTLFNLYLIFHTLLPLFHISFFLFLFGPGPAYIWLIALGLYVRRTPRCLIQLLPSKRPKASSLQCSNRHEAWSRPNLSTARLQSTLRWRRSCCARLIGIS